MTTTIELDDAVVRRLRRLAAARGVSIAQAIEDLVDDADEHSRLPALSADDRAAIEEGLAQAERGEGVPHSQVIAALRARYGF